MKYWLTLTILLASGIWSGAADLYVTHQGIPPNTNSLAGLNAWTNVNPGDTVHLIGTFTNGIDLSAASYTGDYGNPVTFYFEPGANFTAPAWGQKYNDANSFLNGNAFYMPNVKGLVIDGGSNGIIQATANGVGKQWSNRCDAIRFDLPLGGSFVIKNLTITNIMTRSVGANDAYTPGHTGESGYEITGTAITIGGGYTNSAVYNCNLSSAGNVLAFSYTLPTADVQIYSNKISHCSFGIQVFGYYQAEGLDWKIWANEINTGNDWSGNNSTAHGDGIIFNMHQGNYKLLDQTQATNSAIYGLSGYSTVNVSPSDWGDEGDYYANYSWTPNGDTNNTGIWVSTAPGVGTNYTTATNFYLPKGFAIYMTGTPGSNNTCLVKWHPTTNTTVTLFSRTNFAFYDSSGYYTNYIPQWGKYGSYFNYYQMGDTNNISLSNGTNVYTTTTSPFAVTNYFVMRGTPNYPVTARLGWFHAATNINMQVYRNIFGPEWGTNATCWCFPSADMPSGFQYYKVFNNVVIIDNVTTPSLMGNSFAVGDNCVFANNTLVQINPIPLGHPLQGVFGGGKILNNYARYFSSAWDFNSINADSRGAGWTDQIDFNVWEGITEWRSSAGNWPTLWYVSDTESPFYGVGVYKMPEFEANSSITAPLIGWTNGLPPVTPQMLAPLTNDTVLIDKGTNLTVLSVQINAPQLTNDFHGNPRPAVGPWTIGAIQNAAGPAAPAIYTQPTSALGLTNTTLTLTVAVTGTSPLYYQWFNTNGTRVANGVDVTSYSTNSATAQTNYYYVFATNALGSSPTSSVAYLGHTNGVADSPLPTYTLTLMPDGSTSSRTNTEVVTLTCTNAGLFNGWTATAGSITAAGNCSTTFNMPAQDCTVTAAYTNAPAVTVNAVRGRFR